MKLNVIRKIQKFISRVNTELVIIRDLGFGPKD